MGQDNSLYSIGSSSVLEARLGAGCWGSKDQQTTSVDQIACVLGLLSLHVWSSSQIQDSHHWRYHTHTCHPLFLGHHHRPVPWAHPSGRATRSPKLIYCQLICPLKPRASLDFTVKHEQILCVPNFLSERSHHLLDPHEGFLFPSEAASFASPLIGGWVIFHTPDNSASEGEGVMSLCPWCLFLLWKFQLLWRALLDYFFNPELLDTEGVFPKCWL